MVLDDEKQRLFDMVMTSLGAPIRPIQLTTDQLCTLLNIAIEDYNAIVQFWTIENQWINLWGKPLNGTDFAYALSVKGLDVVRDYAAFFSKNVGLQSSSNQFELKKDYITIEMGKQSYLVPKGREIHKVLYMNPPSILPAQAAIGGGFLDGGLGAASVGSAGTFGGLGYGGMGMGGGYMYPLYDVLLSATDLNMKQRAIHSDLTYTVTALETGEKLIHLMSTPGSPFGGYGSFGNHGTVNFQNTNTSWINRLYGCTVWYHYYDTGDGDADLCRRTQPDVLLTPDQVPLDKLDYTQFNDATKTLVRQLLVAEAKILLGIIRGTNSGKISIPDSEMNLDYQMLLNQGEKEKEDIKGKLLERLDRMRPEEMMKRYAELVNAQSEILKKQAFQQPIIIA
ncbi:MAG: hypothetical protein M0R03_17975 [Novosphingobium sp.]|nr:hypothetical protein [Novosphingobium sp.]